MSTYQVVKSEKKKDVTGGAIVQLLTLKNAEGKEKDGVTMFIPAGQPAPVVGAALEGSVEYDEKFQEFKFKGARKGPYNGRSGAPRDFKADPVKQAAIAMEASQKAAVEIVRLAHDIGAPDTAEGLGHVRGVVQEVAGLLYEQIQKAMGEAK